MKENDIPEFQKLIEEALLCQDACNLSGIAYSFGRVMTKLWEINTAHNMGGTAWVNRNRVTRLWASKIQSLAGDTEPSDW